MARKPHRGIDPSREVDRRHTFDDHRTASERFFDALANRKPTTVVMIGLAGVMVVVPVTIFPLAFISLFVWAMSVDAMDKKKSDFPMRLPYDARIPDPNDPKPRRKSVHIARGKILLGNRMSDGAEIWQSEADAVRHWLVLGTTGAGKAQPEDALVLTPDGWKKIGSLSPGDYVSTPYGEPTRITDVHPQGVKPVWVLKFKDGRSVRCTAEHLWAISDGSVVQSNELKRTDRIVLGQPVDGDQNPACDPSKVVAALFANETPNLSVERLSASFRLKLVSCILARGVRLPNAILLKLDLNESAMSWVQRLMWSSGLTCDRRLHHFFWIGHPDIGSLLKGTVSSQVAYLDIVEIIKPVDEGEPCVCIELESAEGLYVTDDFVTTHNTNTLLSVCVGNALAMCSGAFYSDAKAGTELVYKVASMARRVLRDDDVFVLNYITGTAKADTYFRNRLTNTSNPFADGPADSKVNVMTGLMPKSEGDNAIFGERAIALLTAIMSPLVDLRDNGYLDLGVNEIRKALNFSVLAEYATNPNLPISRKSRSILRAYLRSLPSFNMKKLDELAAAVARGDKVGGARPGQPAAPASLLDFDLPQEAGRQFGFAQMYFTRAISSLADTYGHIYWVNMGEFDYVDAMVNRRIGVIMLPAIEKSLQELGNLGKINLSSLRDAMKVGLGSGIEGDREIVVEAVPTQSTVPVTIVLDEVAYQIVEGFAVTAAQARGLNIQVVFAGQDYAGIKKASEAEAQQIIENTNTKIFMKLEGPFETLDLIVKTVGEAFIAAASGGKHLDGSIFSGRFSKQDFSFQKEARLGVSEMRDLIEGEAYITFGKNLIQADMEHADVPMMKNFRVNRYLRIKRPKQSAMPEGQAAINEIGAWVQSRIDEDSDPERQVNARLQEEFSLLQTLRVAKVRPDLRAIMIILNRQSPLDIDEDDTGSMVTLKPKKKPASATPKADETSPRGRSSSTVVHGHPFVSSEGDDLDDPISSAVYRTYGLGKAAETPSTHQSTQVDRQAHGAVVDPMLVDNESLDRLENAQWAPEVLEDAAQSRELQSTDDMQHYIEEMLTDLGDTPAQRTAGSIADELTSLLEIARQYPSPPTPDVERLSEHAQDVRSSINRLFGEA